MTTVHRVHSYQALRVALRVDHPHTLPAAALITTVTGLILIGLTFPAAPVRVLAWAALAGLGVTALVALIRWERSRWPDLPEHQGWDDGIPAEIRTPVRLSLAPACLAPGCGDPAVGSSALCRGHLYGGALIAPLDLTPLLLAGSVGPDPEALDALAERGHADLARALDAVAEPPSGRHRAVEVGA